MQRRIINEINPYYIPLGKHRSTIDLMVKKAKIYADNAGAKGYVLGLSGGIDSFVAGAILAKTGLNLVLISLPDSCQKTEDLSDVKLAFNQIKKLAVNPLNVTLQTFDIERAKKEMAYALLNEDDLYLGNIAARLRMTAQYAVAQEEACLVAGTDHATENVVGYFTKYGDGAADVHILSNLLKSDIYLMAEILDCPESILKKKPAANLGITTTDEEELGVSYNEIIQYLKGHHISFEKEERIKQLYKASMHKRKPIPGLLAKGTEVNPMQHVVIDCVMDFIDGSMSCQSAEYAVEEIIEHINTHPEEEVLYVAEEHPVDHCSFIEQGGIWPAHCISLTDGAMLHPCFYERIHKHSNRPMAHYNVFKKGLQKNVEQYSGFESRNENYGTLNMVLDPLRPVLVSGIATEYCVYNTVKDLIDNGFEVYVLRSGLGYVNPVDHFNAISKMESLGATFI